MCFRSAALMLCLRRSLNIQPISYWREGQWGLCQGVAGAVWERTGSSMPSSAKSSCSGPGDFLSGKTPSCLILFGPKLYTGHKPLQHFILGRTPGSFCLGIGVPLTHTPGECPPVTCEATAFVVRSHPRWQLQICNSGSTVQGPSFLRNR